MLKLKQFNSSNLWKILIGYENLRVLNKRKGTEGHNC